MRKPTQKDRVKAKLLADGFIDNHDAIDSRLTTRLGAIIFVLRNEGMEIEGGFLEDGKNFRYTLTNKPKRYAYRPVRQADGTAVAVRYEV
jgi:hypothetical protein